MRELSGVAIVGEGVLADLGQICKYTSRPGHLGEGCMVENKTRSAGAHA
jgi:hypothetical protein